MFSLIVPGRPCMTDMTTVSPNQFAFTFPAAPHFSHVVVFMLPGNTLPPDVAAAVYMQLPGEGTFRFLGAIANEKPSAIFKVNLPGGNNAVAQDVMSEATPLSGVQSGSAVTGGSVSVGISVEPVPAVQNQLLQLKQQQQQQQQQQQTGSGAGNVAARGTPSTKVLAQRIIKNAFNFLASFAGGQGGQEVVPLKSFEEWWKKFERRVENDPGFLERGDD